MFPIMEGPQQTVVHSDLAFTSVTYSFGANISHRQILPQSSVSCTAAKNENPHHLYSNDITKRLSHSY